MPHREHRKVIRIGKTSYGVVLPIGWVRYHHLDDGKKEVIVVSNGEVSIRPLKEGEP